MKPVSVEPVKLFLGVLFSESLKLDLAIKMINHRFGPVDYQSQAFPFDKTDYYIPEMGHPIRRMFMGMEKLISPQDIAQIKILSNEIEDELADSGKRKVNLDPGYIDYDKVVLASAKYNGDKVYLSEGIWADLTLRYKNGSFEHYPWSFPDFKTGLYDDVFREIRNRYKQQMRSVRQNSINQQD